MTITLLDLRNEQVNPFPSKTKADGSKVATSKVAGGKTVVRDPRRIRGITIHQTACVFGPANDRKKAYRRALNVPAHVVAFRDGTYVIPADPLWYLYTSNELNAFSYGLECEGQYPGLLDDPKTPRREDEATVWGGEATPLDDLAIETFREAIKWLYEEGLRQGSPLEYVWAHRQSNGVKVSDPGEGIWKHVVLDYAVAKLGLKTEPTKTWGDGKALPPQWDPRGVGKY